MALNKYESCAIPRPKRMPKSKHQNPEDANLSDISLAAKYPAHQRIKR